MRFLLTLLLITAAVFSPLTANASGTPVGAHAPTVPGKLISTIDELAAKFDPQVCATCHEQIYEEWKQSGHGHSFSTTRVIQTWRTFVRQGLEKEKNYTKMDLKSHCMWCHAPHIKYASDELVAQIIDMVLVAADSPEASKRDAAVKELSKLNLNCYGCHNLFALQNEGYWSNNTAEGAIYGPRGEEDPTDPKHADFKTIKSSNLTSVNMCATCHHGCPDSVPFWQCQTVYTSYVEDYALKGGKERCQDCHMKPAEPGDPSSHKFPGVHDKDFFASALDMEIEAAATHSVDNYKNELVPTLDLNVKITSNAGHGTPNG